MSSTLGASLLRTVLSDGTLKILGSGLDKGPIILSLFDVPRVLGRKRRRKWVRKNKRMKGRSVTAK